MVGRCMAGMNYLKYVTMMLCCWCSLCSVLFKSSHFYVSIPSPARQRVVPLPSTGTLEEPLASFATVSGYRDPNKEKMMHLHYNITDARKSE